jgi:hypothetical protein
MRATGKWSIELSGQEINQAIQEYVRRRYPDDDIRIQVQLESSWWRGYRTGDPFAATVSVWRLQADVPT